MKSSLELAVRLKVKEEKTMIELNAFKKLMEVK